MYCKGLMERFLAQDKVKTSNEKKAQEYILRYAGELKLHFNLDDDDVKKILYSAYTQMQGQGIVQRWFDMLKSFLRL